MEDKKNDKLKSGRPSKGDDKLTQSINLKLTVADYKMVQKKALKLGLTITEYARKMTLNGGIKSRFTVEELNLIRQLSGEANNLNQLAKRANQGGFSRVGNEILVALEWIKALFYDR